MMKNKFWVIIIGYTLIMLFLGQLFTTTTYAEDLGDGGVGRKSGNFKQICFTEVTCEFRDATLENPSAEEYCRLSSIDSSINEYGIIIEIISGGHFDSTRNHSFHVTEQSLFNGSDYYFYVGKSVAPIYVLCYAAVRNEATLLYEKGILLDGWTSATGSLSVQQQQQSPIIAEIDGQVNTNIDGQVNTNIIGTLQNKNDINLLGIIMLLFISIAVYGLCYIKGYKLFSIGVWIALSFISLIFLDDPARILGIIGIFISIYLFLICLKEHGAKFMTGKRDKI
jgi:hypothetical protein